MATENRSSVAVVPLNGSNYATWKIQCRMALIKDGLWSIVNGTEEAPGEDAAAERRTKFAARKDRALATIVLSVEPSLLYLLGDLQDPIQVWKKLEDQFQKKSWVNKLSLRCKLYSLKLEEKNSVQDHIRRMTEIFDELSVVGDKISEEDRVVHLPASLPDSFSMLVTALESNAEVPAMELGTERLLHEERKLKDQSSSTGVSSNSALTTRDQMRRKGPRCHYCKRFGHIQRYCNERVQNEKKLTSTNQHEKKHRVHKVEVKQTVSSDSDSDVGLVVGHALSFGGSRSLRNWIVDSGATCHICNDDSQFVNLNTLEKPMDITLGDGYSLKAIKQGVVEIRIQLPDGKMTKCVLHDVLHVLELSYSRFSVSKATEREATITFNDLKCFIFNKKHKLVAEGTKRGKLYYLDCSKCVHTEKIHTTVTENLWHQRYGHLSSKYLQLLARKRLVVGLDYDCSKESDSVCESCVE